MKFCRPIKLEYAKESKQHVQQEKLRMDGKIRDLLPCELILEGQKFLVKYSLHMTLIDGKVLSYVLGVNSSQACPICQATPTQMNDPAT